MAYEGWLNFNGKDLANVARTAQLSALLGIDSVRMSVANTQWIRTTLGQSTYTLTNSPWYDAGVPESMEFAGFVPTRVAGLGESTRESTVVEFIGDGGHSGRRRNGSASLVVSGILVGSTQRGVDYGKRWLDKTLSGASSSLFCAGADLTYFRYQDSGSAKAHMRDVSLGRGTSILSRRKNSCSSIMSVQFTLNAGDPYEYGEAIDALTILGTDIIGFGSGGFGLTPFGGTVGGGPHVTSVGSIPSISTVNCSAFDYTPIYDPLYPALVPGPPVPDFYPDGWEIYAGRLFQRYWARTGPIEPSGLDLVPTFIFKNASVEGRMVRASIFAGGASTTTQCNPLAQAILGYIPANTNIYVDGEEKASYTWDGVSPSVRRCDSLVYGENAVPYEWNQFNDNNGFLIVLDQYSKSGTPLSDDVTLQVQFTPKSN